MNYYTAVEISDRALAREGRALIRIKAVTTLHRLQSLEGKRFSSLMEKAKANAEDKVRDGDVISTILTLDMRSWKWSLRAGYGLRNAKSMPYHFENMFIRK
jgi:hypothetical protein